MQENNCGLGEDGNPKIYRKVGALVHGDEIPEARICIQSVAIYSGGQQSKYKTAMLKAPLLKSVGIIVQQRVNTFFNRSSYLCWNRC